MSCHISSNGSASGSPRSHCSIARTSLCSGRIGLHVAQIDEGRDRETAQILFHQRPDLGVEVELTISAAEFRERDRRQAHLGALRPELLQSGLDVLLLRGIAPVLLRREVQDPLVGRPVQEQLADLQFAALAMVAVFLEHLGIDALEPKRYALAHDANRVDRVDKDLGGRAEQIAGQVGDHPRLGSAPPSVRPLTIRLPRHVPLSASTPNPPAIPELPSNPRTRQAPASTSHWNGPSIGFQCSNRPSERQKLPSDAPVAIRGRPAACGHPATRSPLTWNLRRLAASSSWTS